MKIYCKNCRYCYFSEEISYSEQDFCCKLLLTIGRNFYRTFKIDGRCMEKNLNNDCKDYEKKLFTIIQKEE